MGIKKDKMDKLLKALHKKKYGVHDEDGVLRCFETPHAEIRAKDAMVCSSRVDFLDSQVCPDLENLTLYINGSLSSAAKETIDEHLKRCKKCTAQVESARETISRFRDGTLQAPPESISEQAKPWLPQHPRRSNRRPKKK